MHCPKTKMFRARSCLLSGERHVEVAAQLREKRGDELVLRDDRRDVVEHRLALVRVDPERRDHVQERVGVDVLLVRVPAEHELQLGRRHELANDMEDVVADDPLRRREVANTHPHDPAVDLRQRQSLAPLLHIALHRHVLGLPVIRLHRPVQLVRPDVPERQQIERHRLPPADHAFRRERRFGFRLVEDERPGADREGLLHRSLSFGSTGERTSVDTASGTHGRPSSEDGSDDADIRRPGSSSACSGGITVAGQRRNHTGLR